MQYRIFRCRSSTIKFSDHLAQRAQNLDQKWSQSQKRNFAQNEKPFFVSFTAQTLLKSKRLPQFSSINISNFFLDSEIDPVRISHFQISNMADHKIFPASHEDIAQLNGNISKNTLLNTNTISPIESENLMAFYKKYNLDITDLYIKYCKEPRLGNSSNMTSYNSNTIPIIAEPVIPEISPIWSISSQNTNAHIALPEESVLRAAFVHSNPSVVITQAIVDLIIMTRTQLRPTEDPIQTVCFILSQCKTYPPVSFPPDIDKCLVTLSYPKSFQSKLAKGSLGIPDWSRAEKAAVVETLLQRGLDLVTRKLAHEQQYHLLTAADDSVGARPS